MNRAVSTEDGPEHPDCRVFALRPLGLTRVPAAFARPRRWLGPAWLTVFGSAAVLFVAAAIAEPSGPAERIPSLPSYPSSFPQHDIRPDKGTVPPPRAVPRADSATDDDHDHDVLDVAGADNPAATADYALRPAAEATPIAETSGTADNPGLLDSLAGGDGQLCDAITGATITRDTITRYARWAYSLTGNDGVDGAAASQLVASQLAALCAGASAPQTAAQAGREPCDQPAGSRRGDSHLSGRSFRPTARRRPGAFPAPRW